MITELQLPTLAETAAHRAYQIIDMYLYGMKELERESPNRDVYVKRLIGLRDDMRHELKALFDSFEPMIQEQNRILIERTLEHARVCTLPVRLSPEDLDLG